MADATAKFPGTAGVSQAALTDFGGEFVGLGENEWTANGATTAVAVAPFSLVVNEAISARVAVGAWLTTANNEILHVSAINTGTKTFTIDARAQMDTTAAAIDSGSAIGLWLTKRTVNQILAELISMQTKLLVGDAPNLVLNSDFSRRTVFGLAMPEVFADLTGTTKIDAGAAGSVASNTFTQGAANNEYAWCAGSFVWRDGRASATFKATATAGTYALKWRISATDWIDVNQSAGTLYLQKVIAGVNTNVTSVANALTLNRWYWLELEKQGTTITVRMYDTGGTVSGVTKASSTLIAATVLTGTVADASVQVGSSVSITSDQAAAQWGGIATGNGGVYVETWLPESWTISFLGTLGGQAIGYDESADSGPISKQNAMRAYIPAASRYISASYWQGSGAATTVANLVASVAYAGSCYFKVSGKGGSGALFTFRGIDYDLAGANAHEILSGIVDTGQTSWTRLTSTSSTASTGRVLRALVEINAPLTATGTAYFMLPQLEQGSAATAWRPAPSDDGAGLTIEGSRPNTAANLTTTSAVAVEIDSRDLAFNMFLPWDASVDITTNLTIFNGTAGNRYGISIYVDGASVTGPRDTNQPVASYGVAFSLTKVVRLAAGKHRIALMWRTTAGTTTLDTANYGEALIRATAFRGK